jgi:hypothetical protein
VAAPAAVATPVRPAAWWRSPLAARLAVLALVTLAFAPTLDDPSAGDDHLVLAPIRAADPWRALWQALIFQDGIPYWRPLVTPLYVFEVHGIGLRPSVYHAIALGLHLLNVALVIALTRRLTGREGVALAAGLLFGVNAAHAITVAMISSTVELLSVVFYLLTLWCALRFLDGRGRRWYLAACGCFLLALLTKESTATAAAAVAALFLFLDPAPWGWERLRRAAWRSAPLLLLVPPYALLTFLSETDEPTGIARAMYHPGLHAAQNLWWMAARLGWPFGDGHGPTVSVAGHLAAVVLVVVAVAIALRGGGLLRFLVTWTVLAMTPLTLWLPQLMLGRFTYQAAIPFSILLALALAWLAGHLSRRQTRAFVPALPIAVVAAAFAASTLAQNRERTAEAAAYGRLTALVRAALPDAAAAAGTTVVVAGGPFDGPFHALYLQALADTYYPPGTVRLQWQPAETPTPSPDAIRIDWPAR